MTKLTKDYSRVCERTRLNGRPLVVTLRPGKPSDVLVLRPKGCRIAYSVTLERCCYIGAQNYAVEQRRLKAEARKGKAAR